MMERISLRSKISRRSDACSQRPIIRVPSFPSESCPTGTQHNHNDADTHGNEPCEFENPTRLGHRKIANLSRRGGGEEIPKSTYGYERQRMKKRLRRENQMNVMIEIVGIMMHCSASLSENDFSSEEKVLLSVLRAFMSAPFKTSVSTIKSD